RTKVFGWPTGRKRIYSCSRSNSPNQEVTRNASQINFNLPHLGYRAAAAGPGNCFYWARVTKGLGIVQGTGVCKVHRLPSAISFHATSLVVDGGSGDIRAHWRNSSAAGIVHPSRRIPDYLR